MTQIMEQQPLCASELKNIHEEPRQEISRVIQHFR